MSDFQQRPWSDDLNAPKISYLVYFVEKSSFAGILIGSILYGAHKISSPTRPLSVFTFSARFILL